MMMNELFQTTNPSTALQKARGGAALIAGSNDRSLQEAMNVTAGSNASHSCASLQEARGGAALGGGCCAPCPRTARSRSGNGFFQIRPATFRSGHFHWPPSDLDAALRGDEGPGAFRFRVSD